MYKIRGQDQKDFGPCTADVVRQWIEAGRAGPDTLVLRIGERNWKALSEVPEFAGDLDLPEEPDESNAAPARPRSRQKKTASDFPARTSGLAKLSVGLGAVGFLVVTGFIGLILGVVALKMIGRSNGQLKGTGLAVAGSVLSGAMLLLAVPGLAGLLVVPYMKAKQTEHHQLCLDRVQQLSRAILAFAESNDGKFPDAPLWCDSLVKAQLKSNTSETFQCPSLSGSICGFAFNTHISGLAVTNVPADVVMLFESGAGWNGHGSVEDMAASRHGMQLIIGFADGHAESIPAWQVSQLRWLP